MNVVAQIQNKDSGDSETGRNPKSWHGSKKGPRKGNGRREKEKVKEKNKGAKRVMRAMRGLVHVKV